MSPNHPLALVFPFWAAVYTWTGPLEEDLWFRRAADHMGFLPRNPCGQVDGTHWSKQLRSGDIIKSAFG
jgi:hypothetical protein